MTHFYFFLTHVDPYFVCHVWYFLSSCWVDGLVLSSDVSRSSGKTYPIKERQSSATKHSHTHVARYALVDAKSFPSQTKRGRRTRLGALIRVFLRGFERLKLGH